MSLRRLLQVCAAVLLWTLSPDSAAAQQVDVIRGRVTGPEGQPLENVQVTVTSFSGNVNRPGKTDRQGRFSITFPNGDGNYMVAFTAIGYALKKFEVRRVADEDFLLADAKLERVGAVLDQVNATATRDKVSRNANEIADISGTERSIANAGLPPDMIGDLAAMAAQLPGMQAAVGADGSNGFSAFGLGADQNNSTLNGLNFGGGSIPRDAQMGSSVASAPWDVSRGGFSGAQTMLRTSSGTNFLQRRASTDLNAPQMQWTDRLGRASGSEFLSMSPSGSFSGPLVFDKAFYNTSWQLGRRSNDLQTLLNTDPAALQAAGISADSVARLTTLLQSASVPSTFGGLPGSRLQDQGSFMGAFDFTPPSSTSGAAWNVTVAGGWSKQNPMSDFGQSSTRSIPTSLGTRTAWNGAVQARHSSYFGFGILTETSVGLSASANETDGYVDLPGGRVRVNSSFADGSSGVQTLSFGGNPMSGTSQSTQSLMAMNMLSWFSANNKHRLKLTTEFRTDANTQDQTSNRMGTYSYNSLEDLELGQPSMYTRQLSPRKRDAGQVLAAMSLGDSYRYSPNLQFQYGLRVDANRFFQTPTYNAAVEEAFGVRNDNVPNKVLFSPRMGFSWMYGTAAQIASFQGAFRGPRAILRGGIGVFQNQPTANMIGSAVDNNGLPSGIQSLLCVGDAVPTANWTEYSTNPSMVPDRCADGSMGSVFASGSPNVTLFAKDFSTPRSVRSNLSWAGPVLKNRFNAGLDLTYSLNLQQAGSFDRNFAGVEHFAIEGEGNRPVFAPVASIVPATGAIAAGASRLNDDFQRVTEMRSDLTSMARQGTVRISPLSFSNKFGWNLSYTYANMREQYQGFSSNAGDPRSREWSRSGFDSRHQIIYSLNYNAFDFVRINWMGQFRSGTPFTPSVGGDINGDGLSNDRAYVFNPAAMSDGDPVKAGMQSLLASGSAAARRCLEAQLGGVAARNSCQGPWTQFNSLSFSFNPLKVRLPQRASLSFNVQNPLGAADLLLHGENNLKGWGQQPNVDPALLYVRGFDPVNKKYKYEVNQRFGATNPAFNISRNPVILTALLRFELSPPRERQLLTQSLDRGRRRAGDKTIEPILKAQFQNMAVPNPVATILRDQDTLKLTAVQADSLASMNRRYTIRMDSIWSPLAKWWATLPDNYDHDEAYHRYRRAREASVDLMIAYAPVVRELLTNEQYRRLPSFVASALDRNYLKSVRSSSINAGGGGPGAMMMGGGIGTMVMTGVGGGGGTMIVR